MRLTCTINGEPREVDGLWEGESLLYVLRERLALPGSKNACEQGECGSCSVYLDGVLVCSCLVAAGQAEGRDGGDRRRAGRRGRAAPGPGGVPGGGRGAVRVLHAGPDRRHARPAGAQSVADATPRSARRWPATCAAARATRRSSTRSGWRRRAHDPRGLRRRDRRRRRPPRRARRRSRATGSPRSGRAPRPRAATAHRRVRLPGHAGADQLPSPPLPVGDARARAAGDAVRVAGRAVPDVGADRRAGRARGGARRARGAAALGLHDGVRPPLRLPRAATCWRSRSRPRASSASASTRAAARWISACRRAGCRRTPSSRTATRSSPPTRTR